MRFALARRCLCFEENCKKPDLRGGHQRKNPFIGDIPAAAEILWWNNLAEIALLCAVSSI
jgi:hypothetical protein